MHVQILNESTLVTQQDTVKMVRAIARQVFLHVEDPWGRTTLIDMAEAKGEAADDAVVMVIVDDIAQAGALGWHDEQAGRAFGRVAVRPVLDNGGSILGDGGPHERSGLLSVSSVLSHEVLETLIDPTVNAWWQAPNGDLVAAELCDPVQGDAYTIEIKTGDTYEHILVSNFILPSWMDPQADAADAPFDQLGVLKAPFTISPGGYLIKMVSGEISSVFGEQCPEWRRQSRTRGALRVRP
jgi:hypothetical protein